MRASSDEIITRAVYLDMLEVFLNVPNNWFAWQDRVLSEWSSSIKTRFDWVRKLISWREDKSVVVGGPWEDKMKRSWFQVPFKTFQTLRNFRQMILRRCSLWGSPYLVIIQETRTRNLGTRAWTNNWFLQQLLPFDGIVCKLLTASSRIIEGTFWTVMVTWEAHTLFMNTSCHFICLSSH
jgi:hypothetical protein